MLRTLQTGLLYLLPVIISFSAVSAQPNPAPVTIDFRDIAAEAGLHAENVSGDADKKRYILETTGDGVAIFDFDNDGLLDILLFHGGLVHMVPQEHSVFRGIWRMEVC